MSKKLGSMILLAATVSLAHAAQAADVRVYVRTPPPRYIRETTPPSPGRGYIWIPGYHAWRDGGHVWIEGRWELAPRRHARWNRGRWVHDRRNGWYWIEGRWR